PPAVPGGLTSGWEQPLQKFAPSGDTIPAHRGVPDAQGTFDYVLDRPEIRRAGRSYRGRARPRRPMRKARLTNPTRDQEEPMNAVVQDTYGSPDVLEVREIDKPVPEDNQ